MDSIPRKRCARCGEYFLGTAEFFFRDKNAKDGLLTRCKSCDKKRVDKYRRENPEKINKKKREWEENNRDKYLATKKRHYYKYHDKHLVRMKKYQDENASKFVENAKQWRIKHPQQYALQSVISHSRRQARIKLLPDTFNQSDWIHALEYFDNRCAICNRPIGLWHTLAADHWIPISSLDCPGTIASNIVPLCHGLDGCNNRKNKANPVEWLIKTFGKRKAKIIIKRIQDYFGSL